MQTIPPDGTLLAGGAGHDVIEGSDGPDRLLGDSGADRLIGNAGDDTFDTGQGGYDPNSFECQVGLPPFDPPLCQDETDGGAGFDTLTYASRDYPVYVDARAQSQSQYAGLGVDDPKPECMADLNAGSNPDCEVDQVSGFIRAEPMEKLVGTRFDDTIIGNKRDNTLVGGDGADVLCGELGVDTVDYSDQTRERSPCRSTAPYRPIRVWSTGWGPGTPGLQRRRRAEQPDSARSQRATRLHSQRRQLQRRPAHARDCVGEDVENVIGGSGNDTFVGNSPDPIYREAPVVEPKGANVLDGRPGRRHAPRPVRPGRADRRLRERHRHLRGARTG